MVKVFGLWIVYSLAYLNGLCEGKDLCLHPDKAQIQESTFFSHIPFGRENAGRYRLNKNSKNIISCGNSCCRRPNCHVIFFHQNQCFHITCNLEKPELCNPVSMTNEPQYLKSVMIRLRDLTTEVSSSSASVPEDVTPVHQIRSCILNSDSTDSVTQCPENEICGELEDPTGFDTEDLFKHLSGQSDTEFNKRRHKRNSFDDLLRNEGRFNDGGPDSDYQQGEGTILGICRCKPNYHRVGGSCIPEEFSNTTQSTEEELSNTTATGSVTPPVNSTALSSQPISESHNETTGEESILIQSRSNRNESSAVPTQTVNNESSIRLKRSIERKNESQIDNATTNHTTVLPTVTLKSLFVSAGENKTLQLPQNEIVLNAEIIPEPADLEHYTFEWSVLQYPKNSPGGKLNGKNNKKLTLSELSSGNYTLSVKVEGPGSKGEAIVGVTVKPKKRLNVAPVARVSPSYQQVRVPNPVSLDGSKSSDDQKIVKYEWVDVESPMMKDKISGSEATLELQNLQPGNYTIKLTVTDSDGATDSTTARLSVLPEEDSKPVIKVLETVITHLPNNFVVLDASKSFDDKNITSYKWTNMGKNTVFDVTGSTTPILKLSKLEVGEYLWKLEITDTGGQTVSKNVHIYVKPKKNLPPVSKPGPPRIVPIDKGSIILDGSNSTDDSGITKYLWTQVIPPVTKTTQSSDTDDDKKINNPITSPANPITKLTLKDSNTAKVTVTDLQLGHYVLKLTVWDKEKLNNSATVTLDVVKSENKKPIAKAGGDVEVTLPQSVVHLDGSKSHDDLPNMTFHWTKVQTSLAWGRILSHSDDSPILLLTDLMPGDYSFKLTVNNSHGLLASDVATLTVKEDPNKLNYLELHFNSEPGVFTVSNKDSLLNQLKLILHKSFPDDLEIVETRLDRDFSTGDMVLIFYATVGKKEKTRRIVPGVDVLNELTNRIITGRELLEFTITQLDTVECQNNCSGHGHCESRTKICVCDKYWMQSPFRRSYGDKRSNCDWSIVYVVLICILLLIAISLVFWFFFRCRRRRGSTRSKYLSKHRRMKMSQYVDSEDDSSDSNSNYIMDDIELQTVRKSGKCRKNRVKKHGGYALLNDFEERDKSCDKPLKAKRANGTHSNSILETDSDFSSDEETLFVNRKVVANGDYRDPSSIALEQISLANT